jgi:hypothetical protein
MGESLTVGGRGENAPWHSFFFFSIVFHIFKQWGKLGILINNMVGWDALALSRDREALEPKVHASCGNKIVMGGQNCSDLLARLVGHLILIDSNQFQR